MRSAEQTTPFQPPFQPWVEGAATFIGDPVLRLRFLQAVAPPADPAQRERRRRRWIWMVAGVLVLLAMPAVLICAHRVRTRRPVATAAPVITGLPAPAVHGPVVPVRAASEVWQVETQGAFEVYSNGLRVDDTYAVAHRARSYMAFPADGGAPLRRTDPAGIVFHSTESTQAPFEAGHNDTLKRIGESLVDYVRRRWSYHFVIDRFGRVYRVVAEGDAANHAGHSAWADDEWFYLNLNDSFLGVALESQAGAGMTTAQMRSAVVLTEMLRTKYRIAAGNCVTHAQVSVNPSNMRIGYHIDWAVGFPFAELGLPDNYGTAIPAIWAFGFEHDAGFLGAGDPMRAGVDAAVARFGERAAGAGLTSASYRKQLQRRYREMLAIVRQNGE
jgi:N-acetylmuramoyl-L-alanine amidase-like protein